MSIIVRCLLAIAVFLIGSNSHAQIGSDLNRDFNVVPCSTCSAPCGQSCGCGSGQGNSVQCPLPEPRLEMQTPTGLYWNDPCECVDDPCFSTTCFDSTPATIYFLGEVVPLFHDQVGSDVLQADATNGREVLRGQVFDSYFDAGARLTGGYALGDWYRIEGSYLGSYGWITRGSATDIAGNLNSPFTDFGDPVDSIFDENNFASAQLSSELNSVEINVRRRLWISREHPQQPIFPDRQSNLFMSRRFEASALIGLRYMNIDEQFNYFTQSLTPAGGSDNTVDLTTQNEMIGVQIGLLSQIAVRRRGWVDVEIKGGMYQNEISTTSSYLNTDSVGTVFADVSAADNRDRTSWVGELSVVYNHQIAPAITFRLGYNALAATDIALATENFIQNTGLITNGSLLTRNDGDVIYHGPSLGLVWSR